VLATIAERDVTLAERDAAVTERDTLLAQNDRLRHLLLKLTRLHFGARSERLPEEQPLALTVVDPPLLIGTDPLNSLPATVLR
jgi:hypothetical protein